MYRGRDWQTEYYQTTWNDFEPKKPVYVHGNFMYIDVELTSALTIDCRYRY